MITSREVWARGLTTLKQTRSALIPLTLIGLLLPQVLLTFFLDLQSASITAQLREMAEVTSGGFETTVSLVADYLSQGAIPVFILWLLFLTSYFGLVHLAVHFERSGETLSLGQSFLQGLKTALRGGIMLTTVLFFLIFLNQIFSGPAVIVSAMCLIIPVLMVAEKSSATTALLDALRLRYLRGGSTQRLQASGWNVLFMLIVQACFFYVCIGIVAFSGDLLRDLDRWLPLPRWLWTATFPGAEFGPWYGFVTLFETFLNFALVSVIPGLTTALYFLVAGKKDLAQA